MVLNNKTTPSYITPGSLAAHAQMHCNLFGDTIRMEQGEMNAPSPKEHIERLERIAQMLKWNQNMIGEANRQLTNKYSFTKVFDKQVEKRKWLVILYHQKERLINIWRGQLDKAKEFKI